MLVQPLLRQLSSQAPHSRHIPQDAKVQRHLARRVFLYIRVKILAPQCGHCVQAAPEFEKGAGIVDGIIHFAAVDMSQHPSLGSQYGIRGYPTFKFFGDNKNSPTDYQGQRSAHDFVQFCLTQVKEIITKRANQGAGGRGQGSKSEQKGSSQSRSGKKSGGTSTGGVIELDDSSFEEKVLKSEEAWFIKFYSPSVNFLPNLVWALSADGSRMGKTSLHHERQSKNRII